MSFRVHNLALKATHLPASARLVLAAMAYFSPNDDGTKIFARVDLIAKQAGLSVRQVQRIMHRLEGDRDKREGIIVCERTPAGHQPAEFRIDLARLTGADIGLPEMTGCHPCEDIQGCQDVTSGASRGDKLSPDGCQDVTSRGDIDVTPNIKLTLESTPLRYPHKRVRAREGLGAKEEWANEQPSLMLPISGGRPDYPANFLQVWTELTHCPGFKSGLMSQAEAFAAYEVLGEARPDDVALCRAARGYARRLAAENAKRPANNPHPMRTPANWFASGLWLETIDEQEPSADLPKVVSRLEAADRARLKRAGFNDAEIDSWFLDAEFDVAYGELGVTVGRPFACNWIANHFARRLARSWAAEFGKLSVVVNVRAAKEAAA